VSEDETRQAAKRGEDDTLDDQLSNQPAASGPECRAHGELAAASEPAGQQQSGQVHTSNDKDDRHDCHQQLQAGTSVTHKKILKTEDEDVHAFSHALLLPERCRDDGHLGLCSLERRVRRQPAIGLKRARSGRGRVCRIDPQRREDIGLDLPNPKSRRTNADDRERPVRKGESPSEHRGITTEPAPPEAMPENDDRTAARLQLLFHEGAPQRGTDTEHLKELAGRHHPGKLFCAVRPHDVQRRSLRERERLERTRPRPPCDEADRIDPQRLA